ncbi:MAG: (deoxy)nucleoside triphosphate pyrophosphohydrolase [Oscillospiraceae bacterium]|nr:(deoxy)nucleoside triphosphate pyrophosphohydrolase [Oscillospiraceae bacterium]
MIKVVAAIIEKDGEFLLCKRGPGGNCPFLWEFPGGKIEEGETPFDAIIREIREELSAEIEPYEIFDEYSYAYPDREIYFYFIKAKLLSEEILPTFHVDTKWIKPHNKAIFELCPADISIFNKL